ncbi:MULTISPECIES: hypothetical protein [unclassified Nocardia]|uniref:hypothetical protein n=1 Tax=unclassified Nocardia TaxID=2637762 RepID=UPI001CE4A8B8|nr:MULTISPECIES: hypothetical protein [unclassified Nocardia]
MAIYSKPGGCCGATGFYLDTEKVSEQARLLEAAGSSLAALVGSVEFASTANSFVGSDLAAILGNGANILDSALTSHAGLVQSTSEGFARVVSEISKQDQTSADAIKQLQ